MCKLVILIIFLFIPTVLVATEYDDCELPLETLIENLVKSNSLEGEQLDSIEHIGNDFSTCLLKYSNEQFTYKALRLNDDYRVIFVQEGTTSGSLHYFGPYNSAFRK